MRTKPTALLLASCIGATYQPYINRRMFPTIALLSAFAASGHLLLYLSAVMLVSLFLTTLRDALKTDHGPDWEVHAADDDWSALDLLAAPQVGGFPPPPSNPWDTVKTPRLQYPWGWCILRHDPEPLIDGPYSPAGPYILTTEYVFRHKIIPGG